MEVYERVLRKVRGAMWAHHRRLMPERQYQRMLGYVYSHKYEYQMRFDEMNCVGTELGGKVEVTTSPSGYIKAVRIDPSVEDLSKSDLNDVILSAFGKARQQGEAVMAQAELKIYKQFMRDLKPVVMGIRDNPDFHTMDPADVETATGTIKGAARKPVHRTIPYAKAYRPQEEWKYRQSELGKWLDSTAGRRWANTMRGKEYLASLPENRVRGSPGAKKSVGPVDIPVPYMQMDETALLKRNWQAYLENKNVAQRMWNMSSTADRLQQERDAQARGEAWHYPIHEEAVTRQ